MFLLDTNVMSELRKTSMNPGVAKWVSESEGMPTYLSVITVGEFRYGISLLGCRDREQAKLFEVWYERLKIDYAERIMPVNVEIVEAWAEMNVPDRVPASDGLIAAIAMVHDMVLVTRNIKDFARTGVRLLDPFDSA